MIQIAKRTAFRKILLHLFVFFGEIPQNIAIFCLLVNFLNIFVFQHISSWEILLDILPLQTVGTSDWTSNCNFTVYTPIISKLPVSNKMTVDHIFDCDNVSQQMAYINIKYNVGVLKYHSLRINK